MAGHWYKGGLDKIEAGTNAWVTETLRVSLVAGSSLSADSHGWTTIQNFLDGGNSFITNMNSGTATDVLLPGTRTVFYNDSDDQVKYNWPAGKVSFGSPAAAQNFCGVLVHDGTVGTGSSGIWAFQSITGTTQGGAVEWGSAASTNELLFMVPRNIIGSNCGEGFMKNMFYDRANSWNGGSDIMVFGLVQSGSFNRDWATMADTGSLTFCTNCDFTGSANPALLATNQGGPSWDGTAEAAYYHTDGAIAGGMKWDGADLLTGESAVGILGWINSGSPGTSPIFMWNDIQPSISLTTGQDVFWDSFDGGQRTLMNIDITGS